MGKAIQLLKRVVFVLKKIRIKNFPQNTLSKHIFNYILHSRDHCYENNSLFVFFTTFRFNQHHKVSFSTEKHDFEKSTQTYVNLEFSA